MKNVENIYPLSPMQQGMLFHTLYAPESNIYLVQWIFTLQGDLNVSDFKKAWQRVIERHAILRTFFVWEDVEEPLQIVQKEVTLPWEELDWRGRSSSDQKEQIEEYVRADRNRGFVLSRAPVMRLSLIRLADDTYKFICSLHHILTDGWSTAIVFDEVFNGYEALRQRREPELKPTRPYSDYIVWLQKQDLSASERFWRSTLKGFSAPTELPLGPDQKSPQEQAEYNEQQLLLSSDSTAALQSFARRHKLTTNTLVQGAWAVLCARYSGGEDVVFGGVVNGRPAELVGSDSMVGLFINTLPVRVNVGDQDSVLPWLEKLQAQQVEQRQYDYTPLLELQQWSELPPTLPLFDNILLFQNYPTSFGSKNQDKSLRIEQDRYIARTNYPLTVSVAMRNQLSLKATYDRLKLDDSKITRMLRHFQALLEGMAANPNSLLSELPMLTDAERDELLNERNNTQADFQHKSIQQLFEEQVERTPDAIAVMFEGRRLTYAELNRRANQLAHYLQERGVGPDTVVGLSLKRSFEMVVGVLGVLKAGAAYVALDPAYPAERLSFMLRDVKVKVLLTHERLLHDLPEHGAQTISLDSEQKAIAKKGDHNPATQVHSENLAYVIFTSGSTGQPKGTAMTQRALSNMLFWQLEHSGSLPALKTLQFASLNFDVSFQEMFSTWGSGGTLFLVSEELRRDVPAMLSFLDRQGIQRIFVPYMYLQYLAEAFQLGGPAPKQLREIITAGEQLEITPQIERFCSQLKDCTLHNHYGPSEAHVVTAHILRPADDWPMLPPIGRPISNTQIYILDKHFNPVPIGVSGELYIGGDSLGRGYLNRPDLTAEKFLPNTFSKKRGARIYRTGDLARYRNDGSIQFLGRIDNQVKIRGFRIEPGEIETILARHPAVREAVVAAREEVKGERKLVAYVVAVEKNEGLARELRTYLKERLPDYMVPAAFVMMEKLPLTPSGKLDRRALPSIDLRDSEAGDHYEPPRTPVEEKLVEIWSGVLKRDGIGIRDNFFDLGGHSMLAVKLMAEIDKAFGQKIPLVSLFQGTTIEYLAGLLRQDVASMSWPTLIEIQAGDSRPPLFCVSHPNVNALGYRSLAQYLGPSQPVFGLQAQYPKDLEGKEFSQDAVDQIATVYLEALREVRPTGPYQFVGLCRGAHIAYEMARRLEQVGQQVAMLGILDTWVMENTYNIFFHLEHYAGRLVWLKGLSLQEQLSFMKKKAKDALTFGEKSPSEIARRKHRAVYFPGRDFVPRTYEGRITVFRVEQQPRHRIRDPQLGWGRLAKGGVDLHFIPGAHINVLQEPHVKGLAAEMKNCLLPPPAQPARPKAETSELELTKSR